jgi:RHS repeat-associated protein
LKNHTEGFGLMFYNARMYDPALGRFTSADTIVPRGIHGLDRYAYVNNSPINYIDPSGHTTLCGATCEAEYEQPQYTIDDFAVMLGVTFSGNWSVVNKAIVLVGVYKTGQALQREINSSRDAAYQSCINNMAGPTSTCSPASHVTASQAFRQSFGTSTQKPINFQWVNSVCEINGATCYADAYQYPNTIRVYAQYWSTGFDADGNQIRVQARTPITPQLIVHELGHAFNSRAGGGPVSHVANYDGGSLLVRPDGFVRGYSFGQDVSGSEIFADMFVGWVFGQWANNALGPVRQEVMTTNMSGWIADARSYR